LNPEFKIRRKKISTGYVWQVIYGGLFIAEMWIVKKTSGVYTTENIEVDVGYQRQGIATFLYGNARQFLKRKKASLIKSNNVTQEGQLLWDSGKIST